MTYFSCIIIKEKCHILIYLSVVTFTKHLGNEPDHHYLGKLGDRLKLFSFDSIPLNFII